MKSLDASLKTVGDAVFMCSVENLTLPRSMNLERIRSKVFNDIRLVGPNDIARLFSLRTSDVSKHLISIIGYLEYEAMNSTYCLVSAVTRDGERGPMSQLNELNNYALNFAHFLWAERDNCCNLDCGFLFEKTSNDVLVHKNHMSVKFSRANGDYAQTEIFSYKEIKTAFNRADEAYANAEQTVKEGLRPTTEFLKGSHRVHRFHLWISEARKQVDLLAKISLYVTALEALLSTTNAELSFQLSLRTALLYPDVASDQRKEIYSKMKKCYSFRSKALHGAAIRQSDIAAVSKLAAFLDATTRAFWLKCHSDLEFVRTFEKDELIEDAVQKMLFCERPNN